MKLPFDINPSLEALGAYIASQSGRFYVVELCLALAFVVIVWPYLVEATHLLRGALARLAGGDQETRAALEQLEIIRERYEYHMCSRVCDVVAAFLSPHFASVDSYYRRNMSTIVQLCPSCRFWKWKIYSVAFHGEIDRSVAAEKVWAGLQHAVVGMSERDKKDQGGDSPRPACLCWFARHSLIATRGVNLYPPGFSVFVFLACRCSKGLY